MLSKKQLITKRILDIILSVMGIIILGIPIVIFILLASVSTKQFGLFSQRRVGQHAKLFNIYKIRTMKGYEGGNFITFKEDPRITWFGKFLRNYKLDELPQLFNVMMGTMSFVGPRPDVPGYADELKGDDCLMLSVKPGITGPATLKFRNEEDIFAKQVNPLEYNDNIIWKEKVKINNTYVKRWTLLGDIDYIIKTIFT